MLLLKKPLNYKGVIIPANEPVPQGIPEKLLKNLIDNGNVVEINPEETKKQFRGRTSKKEETGILKSNEGNREPKNKEKSGENTEGNAEGNAVGNSGEETGENNGGNDGE